MNVAQLFPTAQRPETLKSDSGISRSAMDAATRVLRYHASKAEGWIAGVTDLTLHHGRHEASESASASGNA